MDFQIFIFGAVYVVFAIALFLKDEADFALIWMLFMPLVFIYFEATSGGSDKTMQEIFLRVYELLAQFFVPIMAWVFMFFAIYIWRNGYLEEIYGKIEDVFRSNRITGYTPDGYEHAMPKSSALMGSATCNFTDRALSIKDQTFVDLSVYTLQVFNQNTNVVVVNHMGLQSEFFRSVHTRISGQLNNGSNSVAEIVRPFLRDVGGNYNMPSKMLSDLCAVAIKSGNTDRWTRTRLYKVAKHLKQPKGFVDQAFYRH